MPAMDMLLAAFKRPPQLDISLPMRLLSLLVKAANAAIRRHDFTIRRWLANLEEIRLPPCATPIYGASTSDVRIDGEIWARIFRPHIPSTAAHIPVILYFHGGGFATLRPDFFLYDIFCRRLAASANAVVVSVNYRRSPEHKFPAAHDDCFRVLRWLAGVSARRILPPAADISRCFLAGDSAGGNLVHFVSRRAAQSSADIAPLTVRGNILIQPFFGSEERTASELLFKDGPIINLEMADWYWRAYLPEGHNRDHPCCNVFGPEAEDISSVPLPPSLLIVGDYDLLCDAQLKYARGLSAAGKAVRVLLYQSVHCFHVFYRLPAASQVLADICEFIKEHGGDAERSLGGALSAKEKSV